MKPFTSHSGRAAVLDRDNLDTDQIIPARFLKNPRSGGYDKFLFHDQRFGDDGSPTPDFPLNRPGEPPTILITGSNFGCGSSREGAVYALVDFGIRAVIAPSFGPIFLNNSFKNGLLAIQIGADDMAAIGAALAEKPERDLRVDLEALLIEAGGAKISFSIDPFAREMLLRGVDEIGFTLSHGEAIEDFHRRYISDFAGIYA